MSLLIIATGTLFRYRVLLATLHSPLDPDAQGYRIYARKMSLFTDTGFYSAQFSIREPLFIYVVQLMFRLIGESDFHLRLVTFTLSIIVIWLAMRIGRALFGVAAGSVIGLLVAFNQPLAIESARGLRLELELVLLLVFVLGAFIWKRPKGWPRTFLLGGLAGLLLLTRATHFVALVPLLVLAHYQGRQRRWDWLKGTVMSVIIMVALVVPYRYNMFRIHGDAFWDMTMYARWNANVEFAGRPGFPTREQLNIDAYVGPRITYWHYMFGLHSVRGIIGGTLRGYAKLFRRMDVCTRGSEWFSLSCGLLGGGIQILAAVGFVLAARSRRYLWIPVAFFLVEFPVAFLYDRKLAEAYRLSFPGFPLVLFAAALTVVSGVKILSKKSLQSNDFSSRF